MALNQMYGDEVSGACVVDVGSSCTKAGFAGEESPQHIFSSAVGTWCDEGACKRFAINRREVWYSRHRDGQPVDVEYPVVQGLVADWDCLERVWEHTFVSELKVDPREHPILIVEQSFSPREQRAKMAEILFEKHGTPGVFLGRSALMCCIAASKTTGLVLECGGGICTAVPVQEGLVVSSAIQKSALAGDVLTDELARRLSSDSNCAQATHQSRQISAGKFDPALPSSLSAGYSRHVIRANFQAVKEALCQLSEWTLPQGTQVPSTCCYWHRYQPWCIATLKCYTCRYPASVRGCLMEARCVPCCGIQFQVHELHHCCDLVSRLSFSVTASMCLKCS